MSPSTAIRERSGLVTSPYYQLIIRYASFDGAQGQSARQGPPPPTEGRYPGRVAEVGAGRVLRQTLRRRLDARQRSAHPCASPAAQPPLPITACPLDGSGRPPLRAAGHAAARRLTLQDDPKWIQSHADGLVAILLPGPAAQTRCCPPRELSFLPDVSLCCALSRAASAHRMRGCLNG